MNGANGMLAPILREIRDETTLNIPPRIHAHAKNSNQFNRTGAQIVITKNNFKSPGPIRPIKMIAKDTKRKIAKDTVLREASWINSGLTRSEKIPKRRRFLLLMIRRLISLFEIIRAKPRYPRESNISNIQRT
jgi:hypothetical protein